MLASERHRENGLRADSFRQDDDTRARFEKWIAAPPYEKKVMRYPDHSEAAWPGQYRDYEIDLAYCAWQAALSAYAVEEMREALEESAQLIDRLQLGDDRGEPGWTTWTLPYSAIEVDNVLAKARAALARAKDKS